jgi:hypothetical protein
MVIKIVLTISNKIKTKMNNRFRLLVVIEKIAQRMKKKIVLNKEIIILI